MILVLLLFTVGFGMIMYSVKEIEIHKYEEKEALAQAKEAIKEDEPNESVDSVSIQPRTVNYEFEKGDTIGILNIPKLKKELPIIEGTNADELKKGVGHHSSTKLPEQNDQIFLAGHRDSVFRNIGELENGDTLSIVLKSGTYRYEIFNMYVVDEHDLTVIRSTNPQEILTLSTCYPFNIIGPSSERYILEAKRLH
jgi:sortase A